MAPLAAAKGILLLTLFQSLVFPLMVKPAQAQAWGDNDILCLD